MTRRRLVAAVALVVAVALAVALGTALRLARDDGPVARRADPAPATVPAPSATTSVPDARTTGRPGRLRIPAISVDAPVEAVGTTAEDAQEVPSALDTAGWWRDGVEPGEPGNAVLVGHTATVDAGVFDRLVQAERGDGVEVEGPDGQVTFRVRDVQTVRVASFPDVAGEVYRDSGPRGLVLMTCGDWNGRAFETTVIVTAEAA